MFRYSDIDSDIEVLVHCFLTADRVAAVFRIFDNLFLYKNDADTDILTKKSRQ